MTTLRPLIAALPLTLVLAACDAPDPNDYGGGARGKAVAKCIMRTERADASVTREQAGALCGCVTDRTMAALTGGGMSQAGLESAFVGCAREAGVEITD